MLCRRIRHRDGLRRQHPRWSLSTIQAPTNMFEITKDGQVPRILSFKSFARNLYQRLKLRKAFQQMAKDDMDPTSNLGGKKHCSSQFRCARVDSTRTSIQSIFFLQTPRKELLGSSVIRFQSTQQIPPKFQSSVYVTTFLLLSVF